MSNNQDLSKRIMDLLKKNAMLIVLFLLYIFFTTLNCFFTSGIISYKKSDGINGNASNDHFFHSSPYAPGNDIVTRCPTHQVMMYLSFSI